MRDAVFERARPATAQVPHHRSAALQAILTLATIGIGVVLLPNYYGLLIYGVDYPVQFRGAFFGHLLWNCAANMVVILSALRLKDRLDRKLAAILTRTLLVHGALAFGIMITRNFHSNELMLLSMISSAVLGTLFMYVEHRAIRRHAVLIGPSHALATMIGIPYDCVTDPDVDLRRYDIVLTPGGTDLSPEWARAVSRAMLAGVPVRHLAEYIEEAQGIVSIDHFDLDHLPLGGLTSYRSRKRLMDVFLVLATLPITLPLLLVGGVGVWATMGRPMIFVQPRVGLGGAVFNMYKLRTMRQLSSVQEGTLPPLVDSRITPLGYWLRRTRIDELPQLWNVLKGDMSIVGPRPEWTLLSDDYVKALPVYAYRSLVRPGITGWAQVRSGYAADLAETRTKLGYDLFYIKNLSFTLDVQILIRTVWTLLSGSGAR